jgi:hypothetical protein
MNSIKQASLVFVFLLISLGFLTLPGLSSLSAISASTPPQSESERSALTLSKVKRLIDYGHPDEAIAREIDRRGINFTFDKKLERELVKRGAGNQTIKALRDARVIRNS